MSTCICNLSMMMIIHLFGYLRQLSTPRYEIRSAIYPRNSTKVEGAYSLLKDFESYSTRPVFYYVKLVVNKPQNLTFPLSCKSFLLKRLIN